MEKTLVMAKPDCVSRRMVGVIISALESSGLFITRMELRTLSESEATELYNEHSGKWHFSRNIKHVTSGPVVLLQVEGDNAVDICRGLVENFRKAHEDVIMLPRNLLHATSEKHKAEAELKAVGFLPTLEVALAS